MVQFKEEKQLVRVRQMKQRQEEEFVKMLAKKHGVGYVDLSTLPINTDALKLIPEDRARQFSMAAFNLSERKVAIAVVSPLIPQVSDEVARLRAKKYEPAVYMTSKKSLEKAWSRYGDISYAVKTEQGVIDISSADIEDVLKGVTSIETAKTLLTQALASKEAYRISKVIELVLYAGYALGASDVHVEPEEEHVNLRFRLDGILTNIITFDLGTYQRILSRIKLTAGLKLNIRENAQDGRFSIKMSDSDIEIRTSTLPDSYGESIVMRILDPRAISVPIQELGMSANMLEVMNHEIGKPNGLILNTGPTGSGKSTTLFGFLKGIANPQIKIITIENPIEYHIPGITQTQVDHAKGYTFLSGLRAALRQDPDVIMVGEIRDQETAGIAANSALTGHLVLSTLHTNSAAGTFARLSELGVTPETMAVALNVALAQRLVRRLCGHCKQEVPFETLSDYDTKIVTHILDRMPEREKHVPQTNHVYKAVGCPKCNNSGYKGRLGIFEMIKMTPELEALLRETTAEHEIQRMMHEKGDLSLKEDGIIKMFKGVTTLDELYRVVDLES